jgi:hypothetical protein
MCGREWHRDVSEKGSYCNVLDCSMWILFKKNLYCNSKTQQTTVKFNLQLPEHSKTMPRCSLLMSLSSSSLHGLGESSVPASNVVVSLHLLLGLSFVCKKVKQSRYTPWRRLGERTYSSYSFSTSALDGGEWSASRPGRVFTPGEGPPVPTGQEAGWASDPVWTQRLEEKFFALVGDRTPFARSSSP